LIWLFSPPTTARAASWDPKPQNTRSWLVFRKLPGREFPDHQPDVVPGKSYAMEKPPALHYPEEAKDLEHFGLAPSATWNDLSKARPKDIEWEDIDPYLRLLNNRFYWEALAFAVTSTDEGVLTHLQWDPGPGELGARYSARTLISGVYHLSPVQKQERRFDKYLWRGLGKGRSSSGPFEDRSYLANVDAGPPRGFELAYHWVQDFIGAEAMEGFRGVIRGALEKMPYSSYLKRGHYTANRIEKYKHQDQIELDPRRAGYFLSHRVYHPIDDADAYLMLLRVYDGSREFTDTHYQTGLGHEGDLLPLERTYPNIRISSSVKVEVGRYAKDPGEIRTPRSALGEMARDLFRKHGSRVDGNVVFPPDAGVYVTANRGPLLKDGRRAKGQAYIYERAYGFREAPHLLQPKDPATGGEAEEKLLWLPMQEFYDKFSRAEESTTNVALGRANRSRSFELRRGLKGVVTPAKFKLGDPIDGEY
jgi:hypothetical protein